MPGPPENVTSVPVELMVQLVNGPFAAQVNGPGVVLPEIEMVRLVQVTPLRFENWHKLSSVPLISQFAVPVVVVKLNEVPVIPKLC